MNRSAQNTTQGLGDEKECAEQRETYADSALKCTVVQAGNTLARTTHRQCVHNRMWMGVWVVVVGRVVGGIGKEVRQVSQWQGNRW